MRDIEIRPAKLSDIPAIREVGRASREQAYVQTGLINPEENEKEVTRLWSDEILTMSLTHPANTALVAVDDITVVGILTARVKAAGDGSVHLHRLYVHPDYWAQSVGKRLWQAYWDKIDNAATHINLGVLKGNARAQRFYERLGFTVSGKKDYETEYGTRTVVEMSMLI